MNEEEGKKFSKKKDRKKGGKRKEKSESKNLTPFHS